MSNINPYTLEGKFIYYTECQLATLEALKLVKRTSKFELRRQQSIADGMMDIVREIAKDVPDVKLNSAFQRSPRVLELLGVK